MSDQCAESKSEAILQGVEVDVGGSSTTGGKKIGHWKQELKPQKTYKQKINPAVVRERIWT